MATGKARTIINVEQVLNSARDRLRTNSATVWRPSQDGSLRTVRHDSDPSPIVKKIITLETELDQETPYYEYTERIRIFGDASMIDNNKHWKSVVQGGKFKEQSYSTMIVQDTPRIDFPMRYDAPYTTREVQDAGQIPNPIIADVEASYNFFADEYETRVASSRSRIASQALPNLYIFKSRIEEADLGNIKNMYDDIITLNAAIDPTKTNIVTKATLPQVHGVREKGNYFNLFSRAYREGMSDQIVKLTEMAKNIIVPIENINILSDSRKQREMFPMHNHIFFTSDKRSKFGDLLNVSGMSCEFINEIINMQMSPMPVVDSEPITTYVKTLSGVKPRNSVSTINKEYRMFDLMQWLEDYNETTPMANTPLMFLGKQTNNTKMVGNPQLRYQRTLQMAMLAGKMRSMLRQNLRTFEDIIEGKFAYSETVLYKIEKYEGEPVGQPVQTYWLANTPDADTIDLYDTQIKYARQYTYVISAYQMVIGTEYEYTDLAISEYQGGCKIDMVEVETGNVIDSFEDDNQEQYLADVTVIHKPSVRIVEIPFFVYRATMNDKPPLSPDVSMVPYRGVSDRVLINFNNSVGSEFLKPIIIDKAEEDRIKELRDTQKLLSNEPLEYKSDEPPSEFQIYTTTKRPTSFRDFMMAAKKGVSTITAGKNGFRKFTSSASYLQRLLPNTKYYYVFRAVDLHGNLSNPTDVLQVEMVDDGGSTYLLTRAYDFQEELESRKTPNKPMKRLLQITPEASHVIVNEQKSNLIGAASPKAANGNIYLGTKDSSVWDRKFKIRITSRNTGKKLDLNLRFLKKHIKTDIEVE